MGRAGRASSPLAWYGGSWAYSEPEPAPREEPKRPFRPSDFGPDRPPSQGHGVVLGRFLPPHLGHQYLIDFARAFTSELTLFIRIGKDDPIPGDVRLAWLRELYPEAVVPVRDVPPPPVTSLGNENYALGQEWGEIVLRTVPRVEYVFTSDELSGVIASHLRAEMVLVDGERKAVPISGTQIRSDPWAHWDFLPPCVRPYYLRRVGLIGPESTGKTTLAQRLAFAYGTAWVGEQARTITNGRAWAAYQTQLIARSQMAAEDALARRARKLLFCDTDLLAVRLWSERLFGQAPGWVAQQADARACDLYLLTDVVPATEGDAAERAAFVQRCRDALTALGRPFVVLRGTLDERFAQARAAVDALRPGPR